MVPTLRFATGFVDGTDAGAGRRRGGVAAAHHRGRLAVPPLDRGGRGGRVFGRLLGALGVIAAARLAQQVPRDAALAARARPTGLVRAVAGVTATAAAVAAARVRDEHVIRDGHREHVAAQLAQRGLLLLIVGHQTAEYPFVVIVRARFRRRRLTTVGHRALAASASAAVFVVVVRVFVAAAGVFVVRRRGRDRCRPFRRRFPHPVHRSYYLHNNTALWLRAKLDSYKGGLCINISRIV